MTPSTRPETPGTSRKLGPVTAEWRRYRAGALPPACAPTYLEAARMAFHAGVSYALASVIPKLNPEAVRPGTVKLVEAMLDDVQAFVEEQQ